MARCIAVADDDPDNRLLLQRLLDGNGYQVLLAKDGLEALEVARRPDVDLVLLDMMMPGLNGLEVLNRVKSEGRDVPIIMVTAVGDPEQVAQALQDGADDYVTKPFSPVVLLARVALRLRPIPAEYYVEEVVSEGGIPDGPITERIDDEETQDQEEAPTVRVGLPADGQSDELLHQIEALPKPPTDIPPPPVADPDSRELRPLNEDPSEPVAGSFLASLLGRLRKAPRPSHTTEGQLESGVLIGGRYRVAGVVGRGAFGVVYRARHVDLEMDVAVKVLRADVHGMENPTARVERFRREAVRACRVRHRNAVRVVDFGLTDQSHPYLVMEMLNGAPLQRRVGRGQRGSPARAASTVADILEALHAAHTQGVVHHDVKPSNVFMHYETGEEIPKLIDFGASAGVKERRSQTVVGTPSHMAPERFERGGGDARADVYSAGVMLFQLITDDVPFMADDIDGYARAHSKQPVPSVTQRRDGLVDAWDHVVSVLLAKDPKQRPDAQTAARLVRTLAE